MAKITFLELFKLFNRLRIVGKESEKQELQLARELSETESEAETEGKNGWQDRWSFLGSCPNKIALLYILNRISCILQLRCLVFYV